jgi:RNA polymerase sigma factor (TIGR02999 family)
MASDADEITTLLLEWRQGNQDAGRHLLATAYNHLRRLAANYLRQERPDHTLQPTALVHELYLRLFSSEPVDWQNRAHFFAVAAQQLRRILVDHARSVQAKKRRGHSVKLSLTEANGWAQKQEEDLLEVDEALTRLEHLDPRAAKVVELRFFGGLKETEIAEVLGISLATLHRDWKAARAWLLSQLIPTGRRKRTLL